MFYTLKKSLSATLFLLLVFGSFCMNMGVHAWEWGHSHDKNHLHAAHDHGDDSNSTEMDCCNTLHEFGWVVIKPNFEIDNDATYIVSVYIAPSINEEVNIETLHNQPIAQSPPDNIKQRISIRISTQLLL